MQPEEIVIQLNHFEVCDKGEVITLAADTFDAENSLEDPYKIVPVMRTFECSNLPFSYTFKPCSLTVLRIPASRN